MFVVPPHLPRSFVWASKSVLGAPPVYPKAWYTSLIAGLYYVDYYGMIIFLFHL